MAFLFQIEHAREHALDGVVKFRLQLARGRVAGEIAEDARHEPAALVGRRLLDKVRDVVLQQVAEQPELLRLLALLLEERLGRVRHRLLRGVQVQRALIHRFHFRLRLVRPLLQRGPVAVGLHVAADRLARQHVRELLHDRLHELAGFVRGLLPAGDHDVGALERCAVPCPEPLPDRLVNRVVGWHLAPPPFRRAARGLDGIPNLRRDTRGLRRERGGMRRLAVVLRLLAPLRACGHGVGGFSFRGGGVKDGVTVGLEAFRDRDHARFVAGYGVCGFDLGGVERNNFGVRVDPSSHRPDNPVVSFVDCLLPKRFGLLLVLRAPIFRVHNKRVLQIQIGIDNTRRFLGLVSRFAKCPLI